MCRMAGVLGLGGVLLVLSSYPAAAQDFPPWAEFFGERSEEPRWEPEARRSARKRLRRDGGRRLDHESVVRDGGARPVIAPAAPPIVSFPHDFPANSILIDTGARKLYYVLADKKAYEYRIGVGREGFNWTGTETISRQQAWPDWYPPAEMRERDPKLPDKMIGGIKNPLGAMALYLGNTLYRHASRPRRARCGRRRGSRSGRQDGTGRDLGRV
jgi:lipoprotein-anchoring transpeptidase ErfK/SrfK